ncbi:Alpha/Beta hydrolase protein [Xylogone sp. PMI_703]|nr:Alpha/Beta hydrolase protein [Xylogone sp. PMI_703]
MTNITAITLTAENSPLNHTVKETYEIGATYCQPDTSVAERAQSLQLLVHGITYNRTYWTGLSFNRTAYSWVDYASRQGYSTLAIDRLGYGISSHPDPLLVIQASIQVEVIHGLVSKIRAEKILPAPVNDIIYVGHSYGSMVANQYLRKYPSELSTFILTGFSNALSQAIAGILTSDLFTAWEFSSKYDSLADGYLVTSSELGRQDTFFYGPAADFNLDLLRHDWSHMDTVSVGEMLTATDTIGTAPDFTGKVLILNGEHDECFCGPGTTLLGPADCNAFSSSSLSLFPNATTSNYTSIPNTGHCFNLHYSAQQAFERAHDWLAGIGF